MKMFLMFGMIYFIHIVLRVLLFLMNFILIWVGGKQRSVDRISLYFMIQTFIFFIFSVLLSKHKHSSARIASITNKP